MRMQPVYHKTHDHGAIRTGTGRDHGPFISTSVLSSNSAYFYNQTVNLQKYTFPDHADGLPDHADGLPDHGDGLPDHGDGLPDHADGLPDHGVGLPDHGFGFP